MMTPKTVLQRIGLALLCLTVLQLLVWRFYPSTQASVAPTSILLQAPSFVSIAKAQDAAIAATIGEEAGIAAYTQSSPIVLNSVRNQFRTIEDETADYIVGSVAVKDYPESEDVHIYLHKDGWILAYYLAAEPTGKIFDWLDFEANSSQSITTKLEKVIAAVEGAANVPFTQVSYYDFRNPNATHLTLIAESTEGGCTEGDNFFDLNIPGSHTVYERSWFIGGHGGAKFYLNNTEISKSGRDENKQGTLLPSQLMPDRLHHVTINLDGRCSFVHGGLALVYKEQ